MRLGRRRERRNDPRRQRAEALARLAILEALTSALARRGEVLAALESAESLEAALRQVMDLLGVDEVGAQAVLDLQLRRLTRPESMKLSAERDELRDLVAGLAASR